MVENTAECVQATRTRISCTDFLSSANLTALATSSEDVETGFIEKKYDDRGKKGKKGQLCSTCFNSVYGVISTVTAGRIFHCFGVIVVLGIVFLFVYASFTV